MEYRVAHKDGVLIGSGNKHLPDKIGAGALQNVKVESMPVFDVPKVLVTGRAPCRIDAGWELVQHQVLNRHVTQIDSVNNMIVLLWR